MTRSLIQRPLLNLMPNFAFGPDAVRQRTVSSSVRAPRGSMRMLGAFSYT